MAIFSRIRKTVNRRSIRYLNKIYNCPYRDLQLFYTTVTIVVGLPVKVTDNMNMGFVILNGTGGQIVEADFPSGTVFEKSILIA